MEFHVTTDFRDDFTQAEGEWNEDRLREFVDILARAGFAAIHWIGTGGAEMGKWDPGGSADVLGSARAFVRQVPDPLAVVCDQAHRAGLRVFAVPKVFDMALCLPQGCYALGGAPDPWPGIPQVGLIGSMAFRWLREHPHCRAELHPALREPDAPRKPVRTIRLWHEDDTLRHVPPVRILVSPDNTDYRPVPGGPAATLSVRRRRPPVFAHAPQKVLGPEGSFACLEFAGLDIPQPFVALAFEGDLRLANTLEAMLEVTDADGAPAAFTYGLVKRSYWNADADRPWQQAGIGFDGACGTNLPGRGGKLQLSCGRCRFELAGRQFLAFARGRNRYLTGILELAWPEVRAWLLDFIRYQLDCGADGVDLRFGSHTESLDWENYGFGPPIVEEFRRRHGVDITAGPFDRAAWQRLRGEHADLLVAEASRLIRSSGRQVLLHLHDPMSQPADQPCYHGMFWNWRKWLSEGLADTLTFKNYRYANPLYARAIEECDRRGVPRIATPSLHSASDEAWRTQAMELIDRAAADGFAAFNVYESAAILRLEKGGFVFRDIPLWEKIRQVSG